MKYLIILLALLIAGSVWGEGRQLSRIDNDIMESYYVDPDDVMGAELSWEAHYNGFIDFIKVEDSEGRVHLFKPVVHGEYFPVYNSETGKFERKLGRYNLEWQYMGVEK